VRLAATTLPHFSRIFPHSFDLLFVFFLIAASHSPSLVQQHTPGGGLHTVNGSSRLRPGSGLQQLTPANSYPSTPAQSRNASPLLHHHRHRWAKASNFEPIFCLKNIKC
jgi:hypothetical protein